MERMSRKERFAEKRKQMATSNEGSLITNDLDKYVERLKQLNEGFGDDLEKLLKRKEEQVEKKVDDYAIPSFEEAKEEFHDFLKELDIDKLNQNIDELIGHKEEKPIEVIQEPVETKPEPIINIEDEKTNIIEEEPVKEEAQLVDVVPQAPLSEEEFEDVTKTIDFDELDKEINKTTTNYENDINHLIDELLKEKEEHIEESVKEDENPNQEIEVIEDVTPIVVVPVKEVEKPVIEIKKTIINPVNEDDVVSNLQDIIGPVALYVKKEKPVYIPKVEVATEPVKEEPVDETKEEVVIEEKPVEEIPVLNEDEQDGTTTIMNGNYLDEAIKEANDFNRQEGNKTLDELKDEFYKNEKVEEVKEETKEKVDEEFSSTVTLEIDKVLNEVKKNIEEQKEETVVEEDLNKTEVFEHPVLAKKEKPSDGLEILPMEETLKLDVIDDTIPFTALEAEEEDDDDEDNGFGKVINIILIVLIIVLLAIIGIIGYFLLAANGVI